METGKNYIDYLLDTTTTTQTILYSFFMHPIDRQTKQSYPNESLEKAADRLFHILKETPSEQILDIIEIHKEEIPQITTGSIPQFSEILDADRIPDIVITNPNCKYKLIGYYFNKEAADASNQKYGENHYKLAAQLGLCEFVDESKKDSTTAVSFLGLAYKDLPIEERNIIRPKLCFQVPFIQHILVEARKSKVYAMNELQSLLRPSTSLRRRSSLQQMLHEIEGTLSDDKTILKNIDWGYKKKC